MIVRPKPLKVEASKWIPNTPNAEVCQRYCNLIGGLFGRPHVHTTYGLVAISGGDWIVVDAEGERHVCKASTFAKTYEVVEEPASAL